jgi:hypothetical protein
LRNPSISDYLERALGIVCLGGIAVTHLMDLPDKVAEAPYLAVMFCGLIATSAVLGIMLAARWQVDLAWATAAIVSALTLTGYVLSRSVGLPQIEDHVGMWWEPAGVASVIFEGAVVVMALRRLRRPVPRRRAAPARR